MSAEKSNKQLFTIVDFLPDPAMAIDSHGEVTMWNQAMERLTGVLRTEAVGKKNAELIAQLFGEDARCVSEAVMWGDTSVLNQEHIQRYHYEGDRLHYDAYLPILNNGEGAYLSGRVAPMRDDDGEVMGVVVTLRDITGRIRGQRIISEEKERLAVTLQSIGDGVIVVDAKSRVTMLNPVAEELTGWSAESAKGMYVHGIFNIVNATRERVANPMDKVLLEGKIVGLANHTILIDRNGHERAIADSAAPIKDEHGQVMGGILVFRDVTEQRDQEMRVRASELRFRQIYEAMEQGMAVHDIILDDKGKPVDYVFTGVNPSFERLTGLKRADVVGKTVLEVLPNTEPYWIEQYGEVALTGKSKTFENYSQELGMTFEVTAYSPVPGTFATLITDVTERRRTEQQLRHLSLHDQLTGLYNRHFFEQELARLDQAAATRVGMLFCDVDGLKLVNDTLGHNAGDELLVATAEVIRKVCSPKHLLARVGGDEFAVLLLNTTLAEVQKMGSAIRQGIEALSQAGEKQIPLSVSIGLATSEDAHIPSMQLFKAADDNMYREKLYRSKSVRSAAVQALMKALETRDFATEGHAVRLQELVGAFAQVLRLSQAEVLDLKLLAQFHDIGKVGVPDRILFKEGPLDADEMTEMRRHSEMGHRIAQSVPDLLPIADLILKHHEWWNGSGYPLGLQGDAIPLTCRLLAIADAYDAMTSNRPYRRAMSHQRAVDELVRCSGMQFDPQLLEALLPVLEAYAEAASTAES